MDDNASRPAATPRAELLAGVEALRVQARVIEHAGDAQELADALADIEATVARLRAI